MAYRDDPQLKAAVHDHVSAILGNEEFTKDVHDRLFRDAWNRLDTELAKEVRVLKHLIWAALLGVFCMLGFFAFQYHVQMSSAEGRCEEACGSRGVTSVNDEGCICNPPPE